MWTEAVLENLYETVSKRGTAEQMLALAFVSYLCAMSPDARVVGEMVGRGVAADSVWLAFEQTPFLRKFADESVGAELSVVQKADALYFLLRQFKTKGALVGDLDNSPKRRPPKTATDLLRIALAQGDYDRKAGCYELSVLYVALARLMGLDAVGVVRTRTSGTGQIGHIMAGVRLASTGVLRVYDLQNEKRNVISDIRPLDDLEFAAHHYNHIAVAAFLKGQLVRARTAITYALALAPKNAGFLNNHSMVLAAAGEVNTAILEASHAVIGDPGTAVYRYQLGRLRLSQGDHARAQASFQEAIKLRPRYGLAIRDLGWSYLLQARPDKARSLLQRAYRLGKRTPERFLYWALFLYWSEEADESLKIVEAGLAQTKMRGGLLIALKSRLTGEDHKANGEEKTHLDKIIETLPEHLQNTIRQ
jgi:Flp pilus assembly protein TadD